jgi:hypothetical protein
MVLGGCSVPLVRSSRKPDDLPLRRLELAGMVKRTFERRGLRDAGGTDDRVRAIHTHRESSLHGESE